MRVIGAIGSALLAVLGILIGLWATSGGKAVGSYVLQSGTPTCSNPKWLLLVPENNTQITAHAFYEYMDHTARLTVDEDPTTAWLQWWPTTGFKDNTPQDNRIHWYLSNAYDLRLICIVDGWPKNNPSYTRTEPIQKATIDLMNKGCPSYNKTFTDNIWGWQQVRVACRTSDVVLYVRSTFRSAQTPYCARPPRGAGPTDCRALTGISEIKFYYSPDALTSAPWSAPTNQK